MRDGPGNKFFKVRLSHKAKQRLKKSQYHTNLVFKNHGKIYLKRFCLWKSKVTSVISSVISEPTLFHNVMFLHKTFYIRVL